MRSLSDVKYRTESIDGRPFDIFIDEKGHFYTKLDGELITSVNLKSLIERLRTRLRTHNRIALPATLLMDSWRNDDIELTDIELTGVHGGNDNVLYREVGSTETEQLRGNKVLKRLTKAERAELVKRHKAIAAAQAHYDDLREEFGLDPRAAVTAAQAVVLQEKA